MSGFMNIAPAGGGAASTVIWSVDFTGEDDHDFKTTAALSLGGVEWTAVNAASCVDLRIDSGRLIIQGGAYGRWQTGDYSSPGVSALFSDLCKDKGATGAYDPTKEYVFRFVLDASSTLSTNLLTQGIHAGMREGIGTHSGDCVKFGCYAYYYNMYIGGTGNEDNMQQLAFDSTVPEYTARSYAVAYFQKCFRGLVSAADESGNAFGGDVPMAGCSTGNPVFNGTKGIISFENNNQGGQMDLSQAAASCFIVALTQTPTPSVANIRWTIEKIELHEVGA